MIFLIFKAWKIDSELILSGCFHPEKESKDDAENLETLVKTVNGCCFVSSKIVRQEQGTIFIHNLTYSRLANILKILSKDLDFSIKPAKNIRYIGNIEKEELNKVLASMFDGWSGNKTV